MKLKRRRRWVILILTVVSAWGAPATASDYRKDIGYTSLKDRLGSAVPDGGRIALVTQTEAATLVDDDGDGKTGGIRVWMPDPRHKEFSGKQIVDRSGSPARHSRHATGVGLIFYGNHRSMAPGLQHVEAFLADHWLNEGYLRSDRGFKPLYSPSRVANHSWVASADGNDSAVLRRIDWVILTDETTQVVGPCRPGNPLLGSAFNTIAVGQATGENGRGTAKVDEEYTEGRTCPQLVAPQITASAAAPVVAAGAALLIELGHGTPKLSTDPVSRSAADRDGHTIYNAERAEVIKAALMAGADRITRNTQPIAGGRIDIVDYRKDPTHQSANGLDRRYGAGQVNIGNSYRIVAGGEQNSREDLPSGGGTIGLQGFDYDPAFGGEDGSNAVASYEFTADKDALSLWAALVWNIDIAGGDGPYFLGIADLYDLDLWLYDISDADRPRLVAGSTGRSENTENLWVGLEKNHRYRIQVTPGAGQGAFKWDYALAWRIGEEIK